MIKQHATIEALGISYELYEDLYGPRVLFRGSIAPEKRRKAKGIYVLSDPRDLVERYVGKAVEFKRRYMSHCSSYKGKLPCAVWINELRAVRLYPVMTVIEVCDESELNEAEDEWIAGYLEQGYNLLNVMRNPGRKAERRPIVPGPKKMTHAEAAKLILADIEAMTRSTK